MPADLQAQGYENEVVLYMALELSAKKWRLAFGDGRRCRQVSVEAGEVGVVLEQIERVKAKWSLPAATAVVSCYEAGRDGFWLHRQLEQLGIANSVVDAASIEVSRRARRAKTDRLDAQALLEKLMRYAHGEPRVWRVVRVPPVFWEDLRELDRERRELRKERTRHRNRLLSKLVSQGVRESIDAGFGDRLEQLRGWDGQVLGAHLRAALRREWQRLRRVEEQLRAVEGEIRALIEGEQALAPARALRLLCGVGWVGAWTLTVEFFGWRQIANRRQLGALSGLVPDPYQSGQMRREQGISKAGNRWVRALMVELAWGWLRHQPDSQSSRWFQRRFGAGSGRQRRIGIVALARRLLVDLWRLFETGAVPAGARLKRA